MVIPLQPTRRQFVTAAAAAGAGWMVASSRFDRARAADLWADADDILRRIVPPRFPDRRFEITRFGASPGGDATTAIRDAIAACTAAGGGQVVVPAGRFETGALALRSNVNLVVAADAVLAFSRDPAAYLPVVLTRYEGVEFMSYSPFIYALDAENVAITGSGTLDG